MRRTLLAAVALGALITLAACGGGGSTHPVAVGGTTTTTIQYQAVATWAAPLLGDINGVNDAGRALATQGVNASDPASFSAFQRAAGNVSLAARRASIALDQAPPPPASIRVDVQLYHQSLDQVDQSMSAIASCPSAYTCLSELSSGLNTSRQFIQVSNQFTGLINGQGSTTTTAVQ